MRAEYRCACGALLARSDAAHGTLELFCPRCRKRRTVYLGGYKHLPRLTDGPPPRTVGASTT